MTFKYISKFLYRSSEIDEKYFEKIIKQPLPFENTEYELRISGTVETDQRIMSFVDVLWGFEVTGGSDQYEPLTVIDVRRSGYAFRAGIRDHDTITRINNVYTDDMTLLEAQLLLRKSGKKVQVFVKGDNEIEECDEFTVDFWFVPRKRFPPIHIVNKWPDAFNWNDRKKPIYKESNCFMVPSKVETQIIERRLNRKEPIVPTESDENATVAFEQPTNGSNGEANHSQTSGAATTNGITNGMTNGNHAPETDEEKK